jgi:queuine tRNA-ribosyltransferase
MTDTPTRLILPHGELALPTYLPDATYGVVRAVDMTDVAACQIDAVVMNTFHLMQRPGSSTVQALGGLHRMSGWGRPIITDSGGFQAYSLIRQNPKNGSLTNNGITFRPEGAERQFQLTPEKTVRLQLSYGADVVICLDDCTHADDSEEVQRKAVDRTIAWAKRCKAEFVRVLEQRREPPERRPLLFGVIQGGRSFEQRRRCAEALLEIGFDGFGYGGWPLDSENRLLADMFAFLRELVPAELPLHALGVGHPGNIHACVQLGYTIFDSAMPTRDARHARLYTFASDPRGPDFRFRGEWFSYVYANDAKHIKTDRPVSPFCDAVCCRNYSLGYLYHLFKLNDCAFTRLATIHNLRFMALLMERLGRGAA